MSSYAADQEEASASDKNQYKMLILLEQTIEDSTSIVENIKENQSSGEKPESKGQEQEQEQEEKLQDSAKQHKKTQHEYVAEVNVPLFVGEEYIDDLNEWFDRFDAAICIPNEGFVKYEITSDGLIVLLIDESKASLVDEVIAFVQ